MASETARKPINYRDGMEIKETVAIKAPTPGIEPLHLQQGAELGYTSAGDLLTVRNTVTRKGHINTWMLQTRQLAGLDDFAPIFLKAYLQAR